jgi:hypothetical protein
MAHTRTLVNGVRLSESKKQVYNGVRKTEQTTKITHVANRVHNAFRKLELSAAMLEGVTRVKGMFRFIQTSIAALDSNKPIRFLNRFITHMAENFTELRNWRDIKRNAVDSIKPFDGINRSRGFFAALQTVLGLGDKTGYSNEWGRHIADGAGAIAGTGHEGQYLRELQETPGIEAETVRAVDYQRFQHDTGNPIGDVKRMLSVFVTLFAASSIRDYIIGRFLKSKEELQIKSKITKELFIDSKIH